MEDNKNLPIKNNELRPSELHDNGLRANDLIGQAISRLNKDQVQAIGIEAAKRALDLQERQTRQNIDYVTGKKVAEDHIDTWNTLNKHGKTTRQNVTTEIETGAGRMRIESKSGATCFVATAAYGDPNHPDVMYLRWYRDNILCKSTAGQVFIDIYWNIGPKLAKIVSPYPVAQRAARFLISVLVCRLQRKPS